MIMFYRAEATQSHITIFIWLNYYTVSREQVNIKTSAKTTGYGGYA